jgi:hypothetical protein
MFFNKNKNYIVILQKIKKIKKLDKVIILKILSFLETKELILFYFFEPNNNSLTTFEKYFLNLVKKKVETEQLIHENFFLYFNINDSSKDLENIFYGIKLLQKKEYDLKKKKKKINLNLLKSCYKNDGKINKKNQLKKEKTFEFDWIFKIYNLGENLQEQINTKLKKIIKKDEILMYSTPIIKLDKEKNKFKYIRFSVRLFFRDNYRCYSNYFINYENKKKNEENKIENLDYLKGELVCKSDVNEDWIKSYDKKEDKLIENENENAIISCYDQNLLFEFKFNDIKNFNFLLKFFYIIGTQSKRKNFIFDKIDYRKLISNLNKKEKILNYEKDMLEMNVFDNFYYSLNDMNINSLDYCFDNFIDIENANLENKIQYYKYFIEYLNNKFHEKYCSKKYKDYLKNFIDLLRISKKIPDGFIVLNNNYKELKFFFDLLEEDDGYKTRNPKIFFSDKKIDKSFFDSDKNKKISNGDGLI